MYINILIIVGILIIIGIVINLKLKREEKNLNNHLEKYRENLKEQTLSEQVKERMKEAEKNVALKVLILKGEEKFARNIRWDSDAVFLIELSEKGIEQYNINFLTKKKGKIFEEILCEAIKEIKIDIGIVYRNRGAAIFPKWDYGSEEKKDDVFGKILFTLEIEIKTITGEIKRFASDELRDKLRILVEWAKENNIKIVDKNNIINQLEKMSDGEIYKYYRNRKEEKYLGVKNHNKIYED
ncbi:hypothetical protein [uncultured Clostridium sp.]|uniref:hypothetical protein n=1 Tax=uncultured Clostridium sp. TaxID=59620 RepID=UPI002609155C|nr:hypothetical protein [uncultured Clostridium sp.]